MAKPAELALPSPSYQETTPSPFFSPYPTPLFSATLAPVAAEKGRGDQQV